MTIWITLAWEKTFSRDLRNQEVLKENRPSLGRYVTMHRTDKDLAHQIPHVYRADKQLKGKMWNGYQRRVFREEEILAENKLSKRCRTSLTVKEPQMKGRQQFYHSYWQDINSNKDHIKKW